MLTRKKFGFFPLALGCAVLAVSLAACGGDSSAGGSATVSPIASETSDSANPGTTPPDPASTPTAGPAPTQPSLVFPIAGGCLPSSDRLMPNAPREYRLGIHEGVDFYGTDNCTPISLGTHVVAAAQGRVIRADLDYANPTPAEMSQLLANPTTAESLDGFRGRQVWIAHDDQGRFVTRYAHLSGIAPGITVGTSVSAGQLVAFVGESGTPESLSNPGQEYHLHFEMRVGDSYLGAGLPPEEVRRLYGELFSP